MTTHNSSRLTGNSPRSPEKINQDCSGRQVCSYCRFDTRHFDREVSSKSGGANVRRGACAESTPIIIALYHLSLTAGYVILRYRCFCLYVMNILAMFQCGLLVVTATMHLKGHITRLGSDFFHFEPV